MNTMHFTQRRHRRRLASTVRPRQEDDDQYNLYPLLSLREEMKLSEKLHILAR